MSSNRLILALSGLAVVGVGIRYYKKDRFRGVVYMGIGALVFAIGASELLD